MLAEDIYRLIEINKGLSEDKKIRIISISTGMESPKTKGYQEYIDALKAAKQEGIFVLTTSVGENRADLKNNDIQYMGLGKIYGKNGSESYRYANWSKYDQDLIDWYQKQLCIPMDSFTVASPTGEHDYVFYRNGGMSWSTPFLAGTYALAYQKNKDITFEEFYKIAMETSDSVTNYDDGKKYKISHLINVEKLLQKINPVK